MINPDEIVRRLGLTQRTPAEKQQRLFEQTGVWAVRPGEAAKTSTSVAGVTERIHALKLDLSHLKGKKRLVTIS